jgi:hypothetical protein
LSINRPMSIIAICKGLSLNDSYWVVEDGDRLSYEVQHFPKKGDNTAQLW